jgi:hypothetical protein
MACAVKTAGIKHVIWSTLEDTRKWIPITDNRMPTLQGKYKVVYFDGKAESSHFFTDAGVPTTFLQTTFYWENMIYFGMDPKRSEDGKLSITFPMCDKRLSGIAAEDIGACAYGIFKGGEAFIGKSVSIAGENITCAQMAKELSEFCGVRDINEVHKLHPGLKSFKQWLVANKDRIPLD